MKKIVLITSYFPYQPPQESFLELEIKVISKNIPVLIAPLNSGSVSRKLPANVKVTESLNMGFYTHYKTGKFLRLVFGLSHGDFWKEIAINPDVIFNIKILIKLLIFCGMRKVFSGKVRKLIKNDTDLNCAIFYSYWLRYPAFSISELKKIYPDIKVIARAHNLEFNEKVQQDNYIPLIGKLCRNIDAVCFVSDFGMVYFRDKYNVTNDIYREYLGADNHNYITQSSGLKKLNIISCSFIRDIKRLHLIINGIFEFIKRNPDIRVSWTHIGGYDRNKELYSGLKAYADVKLVDNGVKVNWLGFMPNHKIISFYQQQQLDVFVNVSESEGIPVAAMEAGSFGIPIVATDTGGISELVSADVGILLKPNFTNIDFARALFWAYSRKNIKFRRSCKEFVDLHFSGEVNYTKFCNKYLLGQ